MDDASRHLDVTPYLSIDNAAVTPEKIATVEGKRLDGVTVRKLHAGEDMLLLEVRRKKGVIDSTHRHDDHETVSYLISGKLRLIIGGKESIAGPGTSWRHPRGVDHYSEALEDCVQVEVKSPPRKTWTSED